MTICEFYRNRRVLITGLTGFKGIWLANWLTRLGAEVSGLALSPGEEMRRGWPGMENRFRCTRCDIRDQAAVRDAISHYQPEVVFHLAAQALVRRSYREPVATFATNVLGTVHVLDAAMQTQSVRACVNVTSDKCYENREWIWGYREDEPLGGHDPYSASKGCAEIVTAAYRRSYAAAAGWLRLASARAGNVIGGGDWAADRLLPDLVRSILAGRPAVLRSPTSVRPWQHVLEPLSGYLLLAERLVTGGDRFAEAWNFGPQDRDALTVRQLAALLVRRWGQGEVREDSQPTGPHESHHLKLDSSKAVAKLGWRPLLTAAERVAWTVEWYQAWQRAPDSVWAVTMDQIGEYEMRLRNSMGPDSFWSVEPRTEQAA
jgi:CDP-glucose 4,6-dehydratase